MAAGKVAWVIAAGQPRRTFPWDFENPDLGELRPLTNIGKRSAGCASMPGGDGPTTSGPSTTSSLPGGTIETMKDTFIPVFNNRVADHREWRHPRQGERGNLELAD